MEYWNYSGTYDGVEPKTAIFNQHLEEFSEAMDEEDYEKAKLLYYELKEMVSPGSIESKILKLDMEMIEADDKAWKRRKTKRTYGWSL